MTAHLRNNTTTEKRSVTIKLNGQSFPIRTDDDQAYLEEVSAFINKKLEEVRRTTGRVETSQIALLALLNITDELFRTREENRRLRDDVGRRAESLLSAIDEMAASLELKEAVAGVRVTTGSRGR